MDRKTKEIIEAARKVGWVMEPQAKALFQHYALPTTRFAWSKTVDDAIEDAHAIGYPVVAKIVSPEVMHKSDVGGVVVGIDSDERLREAFESMQGLPAFDGVLLDEMVSGKELIVGAKSDPQFDMVILIGIGGTSVEIYKDVTMRMAPLSKDQALSALAGLQGQKLLDGYRGTAAVNREKVAELVVAFSEMAYDLRDVIESVDLNPVLCNAEKAVIADARIVLK